MKICFAWKGLTWSESCIGRGYKFRSCYWNRSLWRPWWRHSLKHTAYPLETRNYAENLKLYILELISRWGGFLISLIVPIWIFMRENKRPSSVFLDIFESLARRLEVPWWLFKAVIICILTSAGRHNLLHPRGIDCWYNLIWVNSRFLPIVSRTCQDAGFLDIFIYRSYVHKSDERIVDNQIPDFQIFFQPLGRY